MTAAPSHRTNPALRHVVSACPYASLIMPYPCLLPSRENPTHCFVTAACQVPSRPNAVDIKVVNIFHQPLLFPCVFCCRSVYDESEYVCAQVIVVHISAVFAVLLAQLQTACLVCVLAVRFSDARRRPESGMRARWCVISACTRVLVTLAVVGGRPCGVQAASLRC